MGQQLKSGPKAKSRAAATAADSTGLPAPGLSQPTLPLLLEPGHLMRRAHQWAVFHFHDTHGRHVTPVQYAILRALQDQPGIDQVTLAQRVALDTSTTADIAARLEAKGWIVRHILPRRQRSLHLTDEGTTLLADMLPRVEAMYARILEPLNASEQADLLRLLGKLTATENQASSPSE